MGRKRLWPTPHRPILVRLIQAPSKERRAVAASPRVPAFPHHLARVSINWKSLNSLWLLLSPAVMFNAQKPCAIR